METQNKTKMVNVDEVRKAQRAEGTATILAIGTANPPNYFNQSTFADTYFRITNSEHMPEELKIKMQRICERSTIRKRHAHIPHDLIKENPSIFEYATPSLDIRQDLGAELVPEMGKEAALKAIEEWGQPKSKITHLVCCTTMGPNFPGVDYQLYKLLGLNPTVKRLMLYQQGCYGGCTVLRMAKDLAENTKDARVLVVCSEVVVVGLRGPNEADIDGLVSASLFADGAAALIIGADLVPKIEKPIFELVFTAPTIIPDSSDSITATIRKNGLLMHIGKEIPYHISNNIENRLVEVFEPLGISDWNSIFWLAHPGGPAILDQIEAKLGLKPEKLRATRHVLAEYGNMSSVTVLFALNEMRKKSIEDGQKTTGEGLEWGVLFGFGPGITIETIVLHSVEIT